MDTHLFPNISDAENTASSFNFDFLSNGFKPRSGNSSFNNTYNYIYLAFAEAPFVNSNGVPTTAR